MCVFEVAQPDSAGRQVSLLTADEIECLLTRGASAAHAPARLCFSLHTKLEDFQLEDLIVGHGRHNVSYYDKILMEKVFLCR